ncbi:glucosamine-6-phosphate deaminase [Spirosoma sp. KUDC1026]|uniref:glucosamine-6-phosphate deaminase n=1 Tax=Spirosoma sp. KUDC1026 TaxID=2745947 RepID=UPI00159B84DC|nr:glucosamine-6-phosphate deaminase [Spirosoma sp. KUDC1026]QKZ13279.1 glucosamine-6-phosphate deaminase [Spirosoma sp. KUDC1026]
MKTTVGQVDALRVCVFDTRQAMGAAAGKDIADKIRELLAKKESLRIIFAAAPSQNEMLAFLASADGIDWSRIDVFHMDEYVGLPTNAPQRFAYFLTTKLFANVAPRSVNLIDDTLGADAACQRYKELLEQGPIDIVCLGIGENGHLAFNDPPVADFDDPEVIKRVELDDICRQQQVNDGCFATFNDVPKEALTLTIPTLLSGHHLFCVVPGKTKRQAVNAVLTGPITTDCPASILRQHADCTLYVDADSYGQPA